MLKSIFINSDPYRLVNGTMTITGEGTFDQKML